MSGLEAVLLHDAEGNAIQIDEVFGCLNRVDRVRRDAVVHEFIRHTFAVATTVAEQGTRPSSANAAEGTALPVGAGVRAHQARSRGDDDAGAAGPASLAPAEEAFLAALARLAVKAMLASPRPRPNGITTSTTTITREDDQP